MLQCAGLDILNYSLYAGGSTFSSRCLLWPESTARVWKHLAGCGQISSIHAARPPMLPIILGYPCAGTQVAVPVWTEVLCTWKLLMAIRAEHSSSA